MSSIRSGGGRFFWRRACYNVWGNCPQMSHLVSNLLSFEGRKKDL